ncbi:MAG: ABC transporter ATP-binding protein [Caldilineaceae bacterium]
MSEIAIRVDHLSKAYRIGTQQSGDQRFGYRSLRDVLAEGISAAGRRLHRRQSNGADNGTPTQTIWALDDLNFEVRRGEVVGIIGRNGAGKSTLLKILSRITEPTKGEVSLHGRVGSLLEVGTGFHPELTGRENIFLNGAILGMKRAEIARRFDEIVAFAEIGKFLDTPVKHYSSGMYMRLAFAVAAHLEPELLVVDEVLAVGDAQFQKKCLGKMEDVSKEGRTVLFVSHNMAAISALCGRCIYLDQGNIRVDSQPDIVITRYLNDFQSEGQIPLALRLDRSGNGNVRVTNVRWLDGLTRQPLASLISGQEVYLELEYQSLSSRMIDRFDIGLSFYTQLGQFVMVLNSQMANRAFEAIPSVGRVYCHLHRFPLMSGHFTVTYSLNVNGLLADRVENAFTVDVETGDFFGTGIPNALGRQGVYVPQTWMTTID